MSLQFDVLGIGNAIVDVIARTEDDPDLPQAANSAFLVDIPTEGWEIVRDVETLSGAHNHCEIRITDLVEHVGQTVRLDRDREAVRHEWELA